MARTVFLFFSEVPSHVIAYGSPVPILLYVMAMVLDGPITNTIVESAGLGLQGAWLSNPSGIDRIICTLMRRQWCAVGERSTMSGAGMESSRTPVT